MKQWMFSFLAFFLCINSANAQNNPCADTAVNNIADPTAVYFTQPDFNTLDPNGQPIITNYTIQALTGSTVVDSQTLAKSAFALQSGTPANCYKVTFPTFGSPVLPNTLYKVGLIANNPTKSSLVGVTAQSFFLRAAPQSPGNLRLTILNMLSRWWEAVLSTTTSKPWFQPIGR